jgi:hypothetical protein
MVEGGRGLVLTLLRPLTAFIVVRLGKLSLDSNGKLAHRDFMRLVRA